MLINNIGLVYRFAENYVNTKGLNRKIMTIEDVQQILFLIALENLDKYDETRAKFSTFLYNMFKFHLPRRIHQDIACVHYGINYLSAVEHFKKNEYKSSKIEEYKQMFKLSEEVIINLAKVGESLKKGFKRVGLHEKTEIKCFTNFEDVEFMLVAEESFINKLDDRTKLFLMKRMEGYQPKEIMKEFGFTKSQCSFMQQKLRRVFMRSELKGAIGL